LVPFSTFQPRCAVRGWDCDPCRPPDDPASAFTIPSTRAAACGPVGRNVRPCGFSPSAEQSGVARTGGRFWLVHALRTRRMLRRLHELLQVQSSFDRACGRFRGNRPARSRTIRSVERLRFNPPPEPGHAPTRSFGAVFRYPHGSVMSFLAPYRALSLEAVRASLGPSRPGRTSGPSLVVRRRSWGSSLRRFNPASGGHASLHSRAHMPFAPSHLTRLIFVGLIALARSES